MKIESEIRDEKGILNETASKLSADTKKFWEEMLSKYPDMSLDSISRVISDAIWDSVYMQIASHNALNIEEEQSCLT